MKDEFLATLSHELRTPSRQSSCGPKSCSVKKSIPPSQEALTAIKNSADAQTALIDDLLDTSRIISGKLRLQMRKIELATLVQDAIDAILPPQMPRASKIHSELARDVGSVMADGDASAR